jgi:putative hydrolase
MNAVSPSVIPTQHAIEMRFAVRRRRGGNPLDRLLRSLLGMEAKTRQYVDGSAFVRDVVGRVGVDGFNAIWTSRETLPSKAEIADPQRWIARVHT